MIFLAVMPLNAMFFNYMIPLMIGARDVAFPRLNALSYWVFLAGGLFLNASFLVGAPPDGGWFGYANLTTRPFSPGPNIDFWVLGLQILGVSSMVAGINFIATILNMRAPGMTLMRMPLFVWMSLVVQFLVVLAFPIVTVGLIFLMFDRFFGTHFFDVAAGADLHLWQHLFWAFGHPEVYILILPAFGIVSEVIPTFGRKPLFGAPVMIYSGHPHRLPRLRRVEPPHVLGGDGPRGGRRVLDRDDADRDPDRHQDLQLARHAVGRAPSASRRRSASRPASSASSRSAGLSGIMHASPARRPAADRQLLRRRAHALRPHRRHALRDLRGALLLVAEDDRAAPRRAPRAPELLDDVRGLQPRVLRAALPGRARDAAADLHLPRGRGVDALELRLHGRRVRPRGRRGDLPRQRRAEPSSRAARVRRPVGRAHARVADVVTAASARLRRDPARLQPRHLLAREVRRPSREEAGAAAAGARAARHPPAVAVALADRRLRWASSPPRPAR